LLQLNPALTNSPALPASLSEARILAVEKGPECPVSAGKVPALRRMAGQKAPWQGTAKAA
jgi:hypothetical protein